MSLAVVPLVITGQITGVSDNGNATLYRMTFKNIDGDPLYGVTAVWTDEQTEIAALAAQKPYGVWINPINGTFTVKFAGYTYTGTADLTDPTVLAGITLIEFNNEAGGGSSDFTTCTVTVVNNSDDSLEIYLPHISEVDAYGDPAMMSNAYSSGMQSTDEFTCVLYKGKAQGAFVYEFRPSQSDVATSGPISYDYDANAINITGDGTITID